MELKKIGVWSAAKIAGLLGAVFTLIFGILGIIFSRLLISNFPELAQQLNITQTMNIATLGLSIIISAILYFIMGALGAVIYNILSSWVGGVKLELER